VAELYDRARPSYPAAAIDAFVSYAGLQAPMRIVEAGAGTGKATILLAERGFGVTGVEPSPEMAAVARINCAAYPQVEIVEADFERWLPSERFGALVSVQAWHWIDSEVRYVNAAQVLVAGGTLAVMWTFPDWSRCPLREPISDAYRSSAPELVPDFPMHPDSEPTRLGGDWPVEIQASQSFTSPEIRSYPWWADYTSTTYGELLQTHQDHILLAEDRRADLLAAIGAAIEAAGGALRLPFVTYLCLAVRT
jgi:SAM-dependent methyltransferase